MLIVLFLFLLIYLYRFFLAYSSITAACCQNSHHQYCDHQIFLFFNPFPSILSYFILLYRIYAYMSIFYRIYLLLQIIIKSYTIPLIENHANLLFLQIKSKRSHIWNHLKAKSVSLLILILLKRSNSLRKTMTVLSHSISISSWKNIWIKKKHRIQSYASLLCPLILFLWYAAGIHFFNQYWT